MLKERIDSDLKKALLERNLVEVNVLKGVKSAVQNSQIDNKNELHDEDLIKIFKKEAKKRQEALEIYENAGETERANKEKEEIAILRRYLPEEMSDVEIESLVEKVISENKDLTNPGQLIGIVIKTAGQEADGKKIAQIVREKLQN